MTHREINSLSWYRDPKSAGQIVQTYHAVGEGDWLYRRTVDRSVVHNTPGHTAYERAEVEDWGDELELHSGNLPEHYGWEPVEVTL